MDSVRFREGLLRLAGMLCAALMLLFGFVVGRGGFRVLGQWSQIGTAYSAVAIVWMAAGIALLTSGLALALSGGRQRFPLVIGSISAVVAGGSLIAGVLTYVVPCAGPS